MDTSRRVGVLMGGPSAERKISIKSGEAVCSALKSNNINVVPIELAESANLNGYAELIKETLRASKIDVAFIALHGRFGEDGSIQKILEDIKIPYTGSRPEASRLGMDKIASREIFVSGGIPVPRYKILGRGPALTTAETESYFRELGMPVVVKPSDEGSSIGLSIAETAENFKKAVIKAFDYSEKIMVEEYIRGREITVGILEDKPLPVVEIIPKKGFFDFDAKYQKGLTEYKAPAELGREEYDAVQQIALSAHKSLGGRFFSRVDMILSKEGVPVVLEVNTIPGLTQTSLLPKAAQAAGINFGQLILKILESALW